METRISNFNLKKTEKTQLALKFSQEIRTDIWGDMFRIVYLKGYVFRIIHRKI